MTGAQDFIIIYRNKISKLFVRLEKKDAFQTEVCCARLLSMAETLGERILHS